MELTRTQILRGNFSYPKDFIRVYPTKHSLERLEGRGLGLDCIPTLVRVTKDNIHSGKTEDGTTLSSIVVRLTYGRYKYIFLAINPQDGGIKSLWFRDKANTKGTP